MKKKHLVICDNELRYACALGENIMTRKELAFQVYICSKTEYVHKLRSKNPIHILIIDEKIPYQERVKLQASEVFVLTKNRCKDLGKEEREIYKFQCADDILTEVLDTCLNKSQGDFLKTIRTKQKRLLAVYSPIHRIGKTTFALAFGQEVSKHERTLYLNLEEYAGISGHFTSTGKGSLADLFYYLRQTECDVAERLCTLVHRMGELEYVNPMPFSKDIRDVTPEGWKNLLELILEKTSYETVLLDIGESVQGLYEMLVMCDKIYMPLLDDTVSVQKLQQYESNLKDMELEEILKKTISFLAKEEMEQIACEFAKECER